MAASKQRIAWSGDVPSKKRTKFYNPVLAKCAGDSYLKIHVTLDATQAKASLDEARVQLRELSLSDDALK